jgi:hypothetical protein
MVLDGRVAGYLAPIVCCWISEMLFFFELFLFVLVMLTLALGEFVSRGLALLLWLVATAFALVGYVVARRPLRALAEGTATRESATRDEANAGRDAHPSGDSAPTPLDERWARTLLYNWRRSNALLILGSFAVAGWYWLAR